jgi:hypothetical protein
VNISVAVTIGVPPEVLWKRLETIADHVQWMADAESITFVTEQRTGTGTAFDCVTKIGPFHTTDRMVVTEWAPAEAMGIEHRGVVTGRGRFTLEPRPNHSTRFTWQETLAFPWQMGGPAGAFAARPVLQAVWRRNLTRLKQLAEGATE